MALPLLFHHQLASSRPEALSLALRPAERSSLVAVTVAMAASGCLIATAAPDSRLGSFWVLAFLGIAIEEEVRSFEVPKWFGAFALVCQLGFVAHNHGVPELLSSLSGAIMAAGLLLPLYGLGIARSGSLIAAAALGAIVGVKAVPTLLLLAAGIGLPFALIRATRNADPRSLPVFAVIGYAAAAYPLL